MELAKNRIGLALAMTVLPAAAVAVDYSRIPVTGWEVEGDSIYSIYAGALGDKVAFVTAQAIAETDEDTQHDGYLLHLDTGEVELLAPESAGDPVELLNNDSFYPVNFSSDGNRLLLLGDTNVLDAPTGTASIVFDFSTGEYLPASYLPDEEPADRPDNERLSGDGRYVLFSNATDAGAAGWELTYYRRDLQEETTEVVATHVDGQGINEDDGRIFAISQDGNRLLGYAKDGVLDAADDNGRTDYFVIDIEAGTTERVDAITADGAELASFVEVQPSPEFDFLLLKLRGQYAVSRVGDNFIEDEYAVYSVESGETVGLAEFLNLPERFTAFHESIAQGDEFVSWGANSRYISLHPGTALAIPGDWNLDSTKVVIDRDGQQAWIAGISPDGEIFNPLSVYPRANGGTIFVNAESTDSYYHVVDVKRVEHDLVLDALASNGDAVITVKNEGDAPIHNVAIAFSYAPQSVPSSAISAVFDDGCAGFQTDRYERRNCRVGTLDAGESREFVITIDDYVELEVEAVSMSDPDVDTSNNRVVLDLEKSDDGDGGDGGGSGDGDSGGGSSGGGPISPWMLVLLTVGFLRRRH